ncbi:tryptophan synthase subunit alpha [Fructilactobacillus vespulae]|uniref:tryptophan synthase subunit alpha n=1 Tax=Fructilactobacillus vespulae TaxID=1249630 RepID=UPI0039B49F41
MSKISDIFQNQKAFIGFVVAGDPSIEATVTNILALEKGGADLIEIGIPFSDPVADGPVIAAADKRALDRNVNTEDVFKIVQAVRKQSDVPLVFLTYANLVFKTGYDEFCKRCAELSVGGMIVPDLPYEEQAELIPSIEKYQLDLIQLITPTSKQRIEKIANRASGFIYLVSSMGVTGTRDEFKADLQRLVSQIKQFTDVPVAIGFGVHTPEQAHEFSQIADGIIVGSAIVDIISKYKNSANELSSYANDMKAAIN